ncbi:DMT family transporter [Lutibaculum baratangense]|uniref:Integral membrane protein n=1 Tax=Lutibaculum baratangense AMV1 TaxID=631454 RepID=V4RAU6_9HYPH|nr:DMT family transporter [Lutibaculum baratangense]ESR23301.1 Integral membrane protein [Lutibaculum baratangense AMV1]
MSLTVATAVLLAALLHASWNAILRFSSDRMVTLALLTGSSGIVALAGLPFVEVPPAAAWPWLSASVFLHLGYNLFLGTAYRYGELGKVYPLARGAAPLVTLLAGVFLVGETLSPQATLGIVLLGCGIVALTFERGWRVLLQAPRGTAFALITSLFISAYSVSDGLGARAAGNAHAYTLWLFALDGLPLAIYVFATRRGEAIAALRLSWLSGCVAGMLSLGAYWIVIWAMTVAPIALVAALRETSVLFAVGIGIVFLGERLSVPRLASILVVLAGLAILRL